MNREKLWETRVVPAYNEMYISAEHFMPTNYKFTWDDIIKYSAKKGKYTMVPWVAFFIPRETYLEIANKATKGLRGFWSWRWRSEMIYTEQEIEEFQNQMCDLDPDSMEYKMLADKVENNNLYKEREERWHQWRELAGKLLEYLESKTIDRATYNKEMKKLAKQFDGDVRWKIPDAESVSMTLALGCSPNSNRDTALEISKNVFEGEQPDPNMTFEETEAWYETKYPRSGTDMASLYKFWLNFKEDINK